MDDLINTLKTNYEAVIQSGSDSDFYKNTHKYIDFVINTPLLSKIIDKSAKEYSKKHREIWGKEKCKTEEEADVKEEQTHRLQEFSLYARDYAYLYSRIYLYIEEYKNNTEPDDRPYPEAIVMLRGVNQINTEQWSKETIKRCANRYENKRDIYESKLKQFHTDFLMELEKNVTKEKLPDPQDKKFERIEKTMKKVGSNILKELEKNKDKTLVQENTEKYEINFDKETGCLFINNKKVILNKRNDKNISHYILEYIFENEEGLEAKSFYSEILDSKFPEDTKNWRSIYRACEDINKKVAEQADITKFLEIKTGVSGYVQINPDYLDEQKTTP